MMNFINYLPKIFPNLGIDSQIILNSTANTLFVNSISICNRSVNDIRINLIKKITGSDLSVNEGFIVENLKINSATSQELHSKSTINLVSYFGLTIFLPVFTEDSITYTTELICHSNGVNQKFDCTVDYTTFLETPIV